MKENKNENKAKETDVKSLSRTSIYLSRPKKTEKEQVKPSRKHRLPANRTDLSI